MDSAAVGLIKRRRNQILVHSVIYYRLNDNIIDDFTFDKWSKELAELQRSYPEESAAAPYYEAFADFDGSTGALLPIHDPHIVARAQSVLAYHKKRKGMI